MSVTHEKERDDVTGTETTGHEWDGIKELDTPLPRWWLWTFYACIVFGIGYTIAYPAWPLINSATPGLLHYSSRMALQESMAEQAKAMQGTVDKIAAASMDEISANQSLSEFARAGGAAIFRNNCSQCHGSAATGSKGYPNLQDDDWLWGGSRQAILQTITHGIRYNADADTRMSQMPAFGRDGILNETQINDVAEYVMSLSGEGPTNEKGRQIFADNCAACHGDNAQGTHEMGAPNLTDKIWLYGGDKKTIVQTLTYGRQGVMPAWNTRLSEAQLKEVATYVYDLGGGQ